VAVALASLAVAGPSQERRGALMAGSQALAGLALSLVLAVVGFDDLITRNIIALWLPAALLVAGGLACGHVRALGVAVVAALCAIGVTAAIGVAADRNLQRPDWRCVARALGPAPAPMSGVAGRAILIQRYARYCRSRSICRTCMCSDPAALA
jgi:hypothetical protein